MCLSETGSAVWCGIGIGDWGDEEDEEDEEDKIKDTLPITNYQLPITHYPIPYGPAKTACSISSRLREYLNERNMSW